MCLLDGIKDEGLRYKGALDNDVRVSGDASDLARWLANRHVGDADTSSTPLLEEIRTVDGRSLYGYLRNDPPPARLDEALPVEVTPPESAVWTVTSFEQACNNVGLGAAYRDVLYAFLAEGCRAEASLQGVEIIGGPDHNRTLAAFELHGGPVFTCTLQLEVLKDGGDGTKSVFFVPGQTADDLVSEIRSLLAGP